MQIDINSRKQLNKPENYAAFYSLLNRLPTSDRDALKESIVSQYTEGRTTSLRDMTLKEYSAAVSAMQKLVPPTYTIRFMSEIIVPDKPVSSLYFEKINKLPMTATHNKVLITFLDGIHLLNATQ